jgi:hypothetical protein
MPAKPGRAENTLGAGHSQIAPRAPVDVRFGALFGARFDDLWRLRRLAPAPAAV